MSDWRERLTGILEPKLSAPDPRPLISAYHDMPYAIFRYPPEEEFAGRSEVRLLQTRLEQGGKRITTVSLAECLATALHAEGMDGEALAQAEVSVGLDKTIETVFEIISSCQPLDKLVVEQIPPILTHFAMSLSLPAQAPNSRCIELRRCLNSSKAKWTCLASFSIRASSRGPLGCASWVS